MIKYGTNRLVKVEKAIEERLKRQAKRYNKIYHGEMFNVDTKRLPLIKGKNKQSRENIFLSASMTIQENYTQVFMVINRNSVQPHFHSMTY